MQSDVTISSVRMQSPNSSPHALRPLSSSPVTASTSIKLENYPISTTNKNVLTATVDNQNSSLKITPVHSTTSLNGLNQHHQQLQHSQHLHSSPIQQQQQHSQHIVNGASNGQISINFTSIGGRMSPKTLLTTSNAASTPISVNGLNVSQQQQGGFQIISTTTAPATQHSNNFGIKKSLNGKNGIVRHQQHTNEATIGNTIHHNDNLITSTNGTHLKDSSKIMTNTSKVDSEPPTKVLKLVNGIAGSLTLSQVCFYYNYYLNYIYKQYLMILILYFFIFIGCGKPTSYAFWTINKWFSYH